MRQKNIYIQKNITLNRQVIQRETMREIKFDLETTYVSVGEN